MARQTTHPQKRGRREKALLQRKNELQAWESGTIHTDRVSSWVPGHDQEGQKERKIDICKKEIAILEKRT